VSQLLLAQGDARSLPLADTSVHCIVTSPPYYGLRDYGTGTWQLGLEALHDCQGWATGENCEECYICHMRAVARECWRVLRNDGTMWWNIGDSYNAAGRQGHGTRIGYKQGTNRASATGQDAHRSTAPGLKPKDLCMIPARLALAFQADGWYLRSEIIWSKPNPMPESVTDRPTRSHEQVFLFSKGEQYFYDQDAVREKPTMKPQRRLTPQTRQERQYAVDGWAQPRILREEPARDGNPSGRNTHTVWRLTNEPTPWAHFATMPTALAKRCILAGTSAQGVCCTCGAPWVREVTRVRHGQQDYGGKYLAASAPRNGRKMNASVRAARAHGMAHDTPFVAPLTTGWRPSCAHDAPAQPALVFDPFVGSGTTLLVARALQRHAIGTDLSLSYLCDIARTRLGLATLAAWEGRSAGTTLETYTDLPLFSLT
jgi:DNA modification methylase